MISELGIDKLQHDTLLTIAQFSSSVDTEVSETVNDLGSIQNKIRNIKQMAMGTNLYSGLSHISKAVLPRLREDSLKIMITMTDGGRRDEIQRSVFEHIKSNFKFMVAVGVGTEVEDEELRKLSTRGRSLHIQNFDGLLYLNGNILQSIAASCMDKTLKPVPLTSSKQNFTPAKQTPPAFSTPRRTDNRQHLKRFEPAAARDNFSVFIQEGKDEFFVNEGETIQLKCSANSSVPAYALAWFRKEHEVLKSARTTSVNGLLVIQNINSSDTGEYKCIGSNIYKSDEVTVRITVNKGLNKAFLRN